MDQKIRVRFAPSPTGPLHIGGVRTALYNYLFARKLGGSFVLRIEDTDQTRYVPGAEEYIIESLNWAGLSFDEGVQIGGSYGPYRQSERKEIYKPYALQLVREGKAYYAFDTAAELEALRKEAEQKTKGGVFQYDSSTRMGLKNSLTLDPAEVQTMLDNNAPYVIRIKVPENEEIHLEDLIRGHVSVHSNILDDKVLYKSDGMPTYHLANVVDDHLMEISHVIRGEEWLPSAPMHVLLYRFLGWENTMPQFAHLPLLLKPDGNGKLSKRDGDRLGFPVFPLEWTDPKTGETSSGYRESGYLPEAFINFLSLLGWNPGTERELFSLSELVEEFSLHHVHKAGAKFDFEKAKWFNQQYLKEKDDKFLALHLKKQLDSLERGIEYPSAEYLAMVCFLIKERATFLTDLASISLYFFEDPQEFDEESVKKRWKPESSGIILKLAKTFENSDFSDPVELESLFKKFLEENQISGGAALAPLRLVVTGKPGGPGLFDIMCLIGKETTLKRMVNCPLHSKN